MASIRLVNLRKRYGGEQVLRGINLQVEDGEFMVFVGPSGCAKSTTLRLIAGLEKASDGEIWVGGRMINHLPPKDRDLAMVFQSYALFPHMTVRDNLAFGMRVRGESAGKINAEIERVVKMLGLTKLLDRKPGALSGGQAQRVALGRAIIRRPAAYLFDEPLSNLDFELRISMRAEISALQRQLGVTTVYVTHDQTEAMTMSDRIAVMKEGEIMQVGTAAKLYADPDNLFVAGFLGNPKINLFAGDSCVGDAVLRPASRNNGQVVVGLRPEQLRVAPVPGGGAAWFEANAESREHLGHETLLWLRPANAAGRSSSFAVRAQNADAVERGHNVRVEFSPHNALLFDAASGRRLRANVSAGASS